MNFTASTSVVASPGPSIVSPGTLAATPATIAGRFMKVCSRCARRGRLSLVIASAEGSSTTSSSFGCARAAQQVDDAVELGAAGVEALRIDALVAEQRVGELVGAVDHEDVLVIEEGGEPQADQVVHPVGVEIVVQLQHDVVRGRDVLQLAQHAAAAVGDRLGQQLRSCCSSTSSARSAAESTATTTQMIATMTTMPIGAAPSARARSSSLRLRNFRKLRQSLSPHGVPPGLDVCRAARP